MTGTSDIGNLLLSPLADALVAMSGSVRACQTRAAQVAAARGVPRDGLQRQCTCQEDDKSHEVAAYDLVEV